MAELGTRAEPLGEGARAEKGEGKERQLKPLRRREGMQHVRTAYLFLTKFNQILINSSLADGKCIQKISYEYVWYFLSYRAHRQTHTHTHTHTHIQTQMIT